MLNNIILYIDWPREAVYMQGNETFYSSPLPGCWDIFFGASKYWLRFNYSGRIIEDILGKINVNQLKI